MIHAIDVLRWSPADLRRRLDAGEPIAVLDVREDDERRHCAIPLPPIAADLHVPIGHVPDHFDAIRRAADGRSLVVYCHHGVRSLATAQWLAGRGLAEVANLDGGIDAWSLTIDPDVPEVLTRPRPERCRILAMRPRLAPTLVLLGSAGLVVGLGMAVRDPGVPLGVPGEWTWSRLGAGIAPVGVDLGLAAVGLGVYAGFAAVGRRDLGRDRVGRWREAAWLAALLAMGAFAQYAAMAAAPPGYGEEKAVTLAMTGSSGYYHIARSEMADPIAFLGAYPGWIRSQDVYHVGTHPPGLFLASRAALGLMDASPGLARWVDGAMPSDLAVAFRQIIGPIPRADRAALTLIAALTLLACAVTSVPLYLMLRGSGAGPATSWSAAALWPLVPSAILFQPTADAAFPMLAAVAVALATRRGVIASVGSGAVLALGMACSLVFLAVGLVVGLMHATAPGVPIRRRATSVLATGLGFLATTLVGWAITGANPFVIWWWNQANHARFYVEHPRSYLPWLSANPIELAVAIGLPATTWGLVALVTGRAPRASWLTLIVLLLLTLTGRNLSEVGRLWLPFFPMLLAAAGPGQARLGGGPATLFLTVLLMAAQVVTLELTIQVVYPVS